MISLVVTSPCVPLHPISHPQIPEPFRTLRPRKPNQISTFHTLAFRGSATSSDSTTSTLFEKQPGGIPSFPFWNRLSILPLHQCGIFSALFHFPEAFPK